MPPPGHIKPESVYVSRCACDLLDATCQGKLGRCELQLNVFSFRGLKCALPQRRFLTAKEKHRPKLKDWGKDGFATSREGDFLALGSLSTGFTDISNPTLALADDESSKTAIFRVNASNLSQHDFIHCFERPAVPCIISDIPTLEQWPANERWGSWSYFRCMKDSYFKVGEDDDGYSVKVYASNYSVHLSSEVSLY